MAIDSQHYFDDAFIASFLKSSRQRHELTLEQLSRLTKEIDPSGVGISRVALSRYENGSSLPGLRELRLLSFALRRPLSLLAYGEFTDPMSSYRIELEMRIMEVVNDHLTAEGLIKGDQSQDPESEQFKTLLSRVKNAI
jgi:transcriptional regulator with XRE-family HTH domain